MKDHFSARMFSGFVLTLVLLSALWGLPDPAEALTVTELDFTSGSVALKNGSTTILSGGFNTNGQIVMGQYQPFPDIIAPISLGPYTFSLFTGGPSPFPSSSTSGSIITADLNALFAKVTGPLLPSGGLNANIGGNAIGSFNDLTNAFTDLTWSRSLNSFAGLPIFLQGKTVEFTLNGTAQLAPVPLPGAALLFGSGLAGLILTRARKLSS